LIEWARSTFGIDVNVSDSVLSPVQPPATKEKLREVLQSLNSWEMAGKIYESQCPCSFRATLTSPLLALERAILSTKSFLIGLAVVKRYLNVERAAQAASVEVDSQIQVWGEVEDSE
jgi:ATP synthase F1 complex assembly factor 2